jgi:hypothetical protein
MEEIIQGIVLCVEIRPSIRLLKPQDASSAESGAQQRMRAGSVGATHQFLVRRGGAVESAYACSQPPQACDVEPSVSREVAPA